MSEVEIDRDIFSELLLKGGVCCVDARIRIVLAEDSDAGEAWERIGRTRSK